MKNVSFLICLLCVSLMGCFSSDNVNFKKIEQLKVKTIGLKKVVLTGNALMQNDNDMGVTVKKVEADIFIDGVDVADLVQNVSVDVPAMSEFRLPLEFSIPTLEAIGNIQNIFGKKNKDLKLNLEMKGNITVDLLGKDVLIPFEQQKLVGEEEPQQ